MEAKINSNNNFIRVNFSNRGLSKVIKSVRSIDSRVDNKDALVEIAKILEDIKIERKEPKGFVSIQELQGVDYIGYIIEKERLDKETGRWLRVDEYRIFGSKATSFKDSRVAYGHVYRYRIKALVKVTKPVLKSDHSQFDVQESIRRIEEDTIRRALESQQEAIEVATRTTSAGITTNTSTGRTGGLSFPILSNVRVETNETQTNIVRDSTQMSKTLTDARQSENTVLKNASLASQNISNEELQKLVLENIERFIKTRVEFLSYYYESDVGNGWKYITVAENVPPPPPSSIEIIPNTPERRISIAWLTPANSQRDIHKFRLYRRERVGLGWTLLQEGSLRENFYDDYAVKIGRKYIYAITSVDVHGIESFLSMQIQAELNTNFDVERRERKLKWISGSGARPDKDHQKVFKKFYEPEFPIVAKNNFVIGPQAGFRETQKRFLVKIKSLDMHESKEFVFIMENENTKLE